MSGLPNVPPDIEKLYKEKGASGERLSADTLKMLLISMNRRYAELGRKTIIVCDALDEMDIEMQRSKLLPLFRNLKEAGFKIFLTSRPYPEDVQDSFRSAIQIDVVADKTDLRMHVQAKLAGNSRFQNVMRTAKGLRQDDIVTSLVSSADGM